MLTPIPKFRLKIQNVLAENIKSFTKKEKNTVSLFFMNFRMADTKAFQFVPVFHMNMYGIILPVLLQHSGYGAYSIHAIPAQ